MPGEPMDNVRLALDLYEAGEVMMRQNLRRRHPDAGEDEIEAMIVRWLMDKPSHAEVEGFRRRVPSE